MVRYLYAWTTLVLVGAVAVLTLPWLGLIALLVASLVALGALAAFAWAIVFVPLAIGRSIARRWQDRGSASPRTTEALSPAERHA
jgi:hypothetical protein